MSAAMSLFHEDQTDVYILNVIVYLMLGIGNHAILTFNSMSQHCLLPVPAVPLFVNQQGL